MQVRYLSPALAQISLNVHLTLPADGRRCGLRTDETRGHYRIPLRRHIMPTPIPRRISK